MARRYVRLKKGSAGLLILLFLFAVFSHYTKLSAPLESLVTQFLQPVQVFFYSYSPNRKIIPVDNEDEMTRDELFEERSILQDEINNLLIENAYLNSLVDQTTLLEEQLAYLRDRSFEAIPAQVSSRSSENLSQTLLLNRGSKDGVIEGLPVIIDTGVLVGLIQEVNEYSSEVLLITSFDSLVSATVQNDQNSPGMVSGKHNLSLSMDFIPQLDDISIGQTVLTSGVEKRIPAGLVIGQIQETFSEPGSLFQSASLRPLFDANDLVVLSIIVL